MRLKRCTTSRIKKPRGINIAAVNASWGSSDTGGLGAAVDEVLASDVMIIHAAGNSAENAADFLGSKVGAMSVAATDQNGAGADFTNFGDYVEISAPAWTSSASGLGPTQTPPTTQPSAALPWRRRMPARSQGCWSRSIRGSRPRKSSA